VQVFDCDCGETLSAANNDDLARELKRHFEEDHPDQELSDDQARERVEGKAYAAMDS
jgi:hypothetical protein